MNQLSEFQYTLVQITTVYDCQKENLTSLRAKITNPWKCDFHEIMPTSIDQTTI